MKTKPKHTPKNNFTPGPWIRWGDKQWIDKDPNTSPEWANVVRIGSGPNIGNQICSMARLDAEGEANARLIAAAPDLLEAAKVISGWIDRVAEEVTMGPDDQKALNNLRAAIRKAEGE